jgi:hypothetical protein
VVVVEGTGTADAAGTVEGERVVVDLVAVFTETVDDVLDVVDKFTGRVVDGAWSTTKNSPNRRVCEAPLRARAASVVSLPSEGISAAGISPTTVSSTGSDP